MTRGDWHEAVALIQRTFNLSVTSGARGVGFTWGP